MEWSHPTAGVSPDTQAAIVLPGGKGGSDLSSASKQQCMCVCVRACGGTLYTTSSDKSTSLLVPTISTAHQHMHNMQAHMLVIQEETHILFRVISSEYTSDMYASCSTIFSVAGCTACMYIVYICL